VSCAFRVFGGISGLLTVDARNYSHPIMTIKNGSRHCKCSLRGAPGHPKPTPDETHWIKAIGTDNAMGIWNQGWV
jgi:hypothetical protein